jgi:dynein heavy chain 1
MITLDPPIAEARSYWYKQLHEQLEIVCGLQRIESNRYDRKGGEQTAGATREKSYQGLILKMNQTFLNQVYAKIEKEVTAAENYVHPWKSY